ncbi:putative disease resistance protein At1g50180 isoform X1 [Magnolia sinica]|uniref:putative disease resistance protein At1g50180 isoform X1 n=1 Tax=Magnolia sinica TaxID=86752 RepID=UPI00265A1F0B|nr:putative disease resistance protein At1g50180 isoform X1 [Magnolia sinica]XP_058114681.1 putative disease resistance protein At1g50180 isoform X1 [Magnolia sinica]
MTTVEFVVKLLLQKLSDLLIQEAEFLSGVCDQVEWLQAEFRRMQCFLKDADTKQEGDERVKNWGRDVRDVAYDAEDVIDTFVFRTAILKRRGFVGVVKRWAFIFNKLVARHKLVSEIERIRNKIRAISESRSTYGIENIGQEAEMSSTRLRLQDWKLTSPLDQEPDFVGFEKDLEILVARLMKGELCRCVISVVGMGGLGKTTLMKKVYNDTRVKTHFHSSVWISISQEYGVRDLLQNIVNCYKVISEEELKKLNVIQLRHIISEYLKEKKYLIVLDDVWTYEAWDVLKDAFPNMNNGSRVMLTTRNKDVALHADARSQPHELGFLNDEESWELFCKKTFPGHVNSCPQYLEKLGREIVKKCHGLPLAIIVIGGLLSRKEPWEWENVHKSISWQFIEGEVKISCILSLSYKDLPYYLKPCFLYLGIFPEDYEFHAKKLIQLWAAEGFLQQRGDEMLEKVGEDYMKELAQRNMIQLAKRSSSGRIKSCRIHDLLRDLSISEAKENMFLHVVHENVGVSYTFRARRLAIHHNALREYTFLKSFTPRLRSLLIYTHEVDEMLGRKPDKFLYTGFKFLRVLDLHNVKTELPSEIGALIHLRYLSCTKTWLKRLPSSIGNLRNLETLIVTSFYNIQVPSTIEKMQQLKNLHVTSAGADVFYVSWGVIEGHPRLDWISNLHTLTRVKAGKWMEGCLGKLTNLRKLGIGLGEGEFDKVFFESIVHLECLQSLFVAAGSKFPASASFKSLFNLHKLHLQGELEGLSESCEFPEKLSKLTLRDSYLRRDPLATLEKLKSLRILRLLEYSYIGVEMACSAQRFLQLKCLHLERLYQLEEWRVEEGSLPSLLHLRINYCEQLKKLPEGLQHATTLKKLELWNMHPLFKARLQEKEGEDWKKIHHIPSIDIHYME